MPGAEMDGTSFKDPAMQPEPSTLSMEASSRMDLHHELEASAGCCGCCGPTASSPTGARELVWSLILCSISLVYTLIPETRTWTPLNIPLCTIVFVCCISVLWPKVRRNEPLRRSLLTLAHCLTMVVFGSTYWKSPGGTTPKSLTVFPCLTPALQFLFANMAFPLRYQILPWAATIVIPFISYSSGFVQPLPIILLVGSIVFSIISSPTIFSSSNDEANWKALAIRSVGSVSPSLTHSSIAYPTSRSNSNPFPPSLNSQPSLRRKVRRSSQKSEDAKNGSVVVEVDTQAQMVKFEPMISGRRQSAPIHLSLATSSNPLLPTCSTLSSGASEAISSIPVVEIPSESGQSGYIPTAPTTDALLMEREEPTPSSARSLNLSLSLIPRKRNGSLAAAATQLDPICAKEWQVQYESLKEAYDSLRVEKERFEVEVMKHREQVREEKEKYALIKAAYDQNPQDATESGQTIAELNEHIRTVMAERSALKSMLDRTNESKKQADDFLFQQQQQTYEMKIKYDTLKEAFDVGAESQKAAGDAKLKQDTQLEEMAQKYSLLKEATDRDIGEREKAKEQSLGYFQQAKEAQIKYAVLKEAFDKNVAVRRTAEDESAKFGQDRDEMKARFDMLKSQYDKEMDFKRGNDIVREQQAQDVAQANAQYEVAKKSYDAEVALGRGKDETIAHQKEKNRELKAKYDLLKETYDAENIPKTDVEKHNLELSEQVRDLTMKYSVLKRSFEERAKDKKDVDTKLLEQTAQTMQMSANYNALKENFDRGEKRQKMTDDALFELRQQLDSIAAENKVLKVAFEKGLSERNRAKDTIAQQSARALEMNTKYAMMKETADHNDELRKKAEDDSVGVHRLGREMKVKFDLLKESYDTEMVEKSKAETVRSQQNQEVREAKVRYGILKKSYDDELKYKRDHEADGVDRKQRLNEMEIKYEMMKALADEGIASKRKFDADYGKQRGDMHEMKVKYDMLKESYDEGAKERKAVQDEFNAQGESMREMKRKYGVLKVHFDKSVEDSELDKKVLADKIEESKQMKNKYDVMKRQVDSDSVWKSKAEADLRQQLEETRRVEQVLNVTKVKLEKKAQECAKQEETLAQAASQFKVMGWMNNASNLEELEAVPELLPPLTSLNNNIETQSQVSATQSNPLDDSSSISNISHDIRTPLTTAISSIGILLDEKVKLTETDRRDLLSKAYASLQSVLNLVNNILDFEKLRAKTVVPQLKQVNVRRLLISQIRMIEAQSPNMEFILDVSSSVPTSVMIDRVLFQRVLLNLLENAARTSSESGIVTVGIRWNDETETLMGVVVDHGDGLSVSERESVFSMSEGTFGRGGTSLRLSVCQQLLIEMGGSLTVTSGGKGMGSTFEFRLPAPMAKNIANCLDLTSLVFDDDPLRRRATMEMCRYAGVDVLPEASLPAAQENDVTAGVVFATVDCSAWVETMHYWRKQNVAVCMVIPSQLIDKGYQSFPAEAYLRSPIDIVELREVLQKFAGAACQLSDASHPTSSHITSIGNSSVKKEEIPMLLVEDTPVNHSLFLKQLTNMGFTNVHSAFNGIDAVHLAETHTYALIIMDCQMPIMDGFEATRKIREIPAHATTPIIAVTADHSSENIRKCRESGMTDFFTKPITYQTWKTITAIAAKRAAVVQLLSLPNV